MKITYLILISFILFGCTTGKKKNNPTEKNSKRQVKLVTYSEYDVIEKFGEIQKDQFKSKGMYKYDEKGILIEHSYYEPDLSIEWKRIYIYKYDDKGNRIEESSYEADGSLEWQYTYKYDKYDIEGNWLSKTEFWKHETDLSKPRSIEEREIEYY